jgi:uncharacterized protein YaiE (UPF0345 family)
MNITHWNRGDSPTIPLLKKLLKEEGIDSFPWSDSPGSYYYPHQHSEWEIRWLVKGSMKVKVNSDVLQLSPGDRFELPPNTIHEVWIDPNEETVYLCASR